MMTRKQYTLYVNRGENGIRSMLEDSHGLQITEISVREGTRVQGLYDSEHMPLAFIRGRMIEDRLETLITDLSEKGRYEVTAVNNGKIVSQRTNGKKLK